MAPLRFQPGDKVIIVGRNIRGVVEDVPDNTWDKYLIWKNPRGGYECCREDELRRDGAAMLKDMYHQRLAAQQTTKRKKK